MTDMTEQSGHPIPMKVETIYDRLTSYRLAQRYVEGETVADIGRDGIGYSARVLAEFAESVVSLTDSSEALKLASTTYPARNVSYLQANLPELPYPADHFDSAIAFELV